jgi:uncharacterized membrane protein
MAPRSNLMHFAFLGAITIKGIDGLIEFVAGVIIAVAGSQQVYNFAIWATAPELARHPESPAAHAIRHSAYGLTHASQRFVIVYLIAHGVLKLGLAINLFIEHMWIFPASAALLVGFITFMSARLMAHWSPWLFAFALFDAMTLALVLNEWRVRAMHPKVR